MRGNKKVEVVTQALESNIATNHNEHQDGDSTVLNESLCTCRALSNYAQNLIYVSS